MRVRGGKKKNKAPKKRVAHLRTHTFSPSSVHSRTHTNIFNNPFPLPPPPHPTIVTYHRTRKNEKTKTKKNKNGQKRKKNTKIPNKRIQHNENKTRGKEEIFQQKKAKKTTIHERSRILDTLRPNETFLNQSLKKLKKRFPPKASKKLKNTKANKQNSTCSAPSDQHKHKK